MLPTEKLRLLQEQIAVYDDESAYKALFLSFSLPLRQFAFTFIPSMQIAEEIVSDVFIRLWINRKSLTRIEQLRVYLFKSTRNTALNYIRKNKRFASEPAGETHNALPCPNPNPEQVMLNPEMTRRIHMAVNDLPPRCRYIFMLAKEHGLRYKEIAEIMKISVKTIDNQLAIALKKIAQVARVEAEKKLPARR